jgi:hypothetical protein
MKAYPNFALDTGVATLSSRFAPVEWSDFCRHLHFYFDAPVSRLPKRLEAG